MAGPVEFLVVGVLVGPHGVRGELKLLPETEFPERLPALRELQLRLPDGSRRVVPVVRSRWHRGMLLVTLAGIDSRDAAEALRGAEVLVSMDQAAPLPEGRYYLHEILGCRVVTPEGEELGVVDQVLSAGSNDVYVAGSWLIPATRDAVLRLAPEEKLIVVRSKEYLEGETV